MFGALRLPFEKQREVVKPRQLGVVVHMHLANEAQKKFRAHVTRGPCLRSMWERHNCLASNFLQSTIRADQYLNLRCRLWASAGSMALNPVANKAPKWERRRQVKFRCFYHSEPRGGSNDTETVR